MKRHSFKFLLVKKSINEQIVLTVLGLMKQNVNIYMSLDLSARQHEN